ncbi:MAG: hypothetical protein HYY15_02355 [Candidatus Omnitrophica bacterium]|nr:hypothetical protein [Candidatus Omnitrophota bacterium]
MRDFLTLSADVPVEELVHVQEEPALEIALPQVFTQPDLGALRRGKLPHAEWLVAQLYQTHAAALHSGEAIPGGLGPAYQELVQEFQPLFTWGIACWDFLLSTEGCRFVPRTSDERRSARGDYRAFTDRDHSRLLHRIFRQEVFAFAHDPAESSLAGYLRARFWPEVVAAYNKLSDPPNPLERKLSAYSYLRCIPYQFLNSVHQTLVADALSTLPRQERATVEGYFLRFQTISGTAQLMSFSEEAVETLLQRSLVTLLTRDRLVYCLLRQIERY